MATFSLGYEGEEVPGEVKALEINPAMPQQVRFSDCIFTIAMFEMIAVFEMISVSQYSICMSLEDQSDLMHTT